MIPIWLYGAAAIGIAVAGFAGGVKVTNSHWKAEIAEVQEDHREALAAANDRNNQIARELEESRANVRVVYKTITKRVERVVESPLYSRECFDASGLQLANDALLGRAPDPGKSDGAVP